MGTVVYQGLQSCLESQLVEPRTLRLRLSSPKPHFSHSHELALKSRLVVSSKELAAGGDNNNNNKCQLYEDKRGTCSTPDLGAAGWSFFQLLSNNPTNVSTEKQPPPPPYVHPLVKRTSSTLSDKSLELCTENLGSETGTHDLTDVEQSIFSSLSPSSGTWEEQRRSQHLGAYKKANYNNNNNNNSPSFPPPLTTMTGSESVQVRPHRQDGRLILQAFKTPSNHTYFQAERSHGRLRLFLFKDSSAPNFDVATTTTHDVVSTEENYPNQASDREEEEEEETEKDENNYYNEEEDEEEDEDEEEEEEIGIEREMEMEEFPRPSRGRCKEEGEIENNRGLSNWNREPFLVATS